MKVMASDKKFLKVGNRNESNDLGQKFLKVGNRNEGNGLGQKIFKGRQPK